MVSFLNRPCGNASLTPQVPYENLAQLLHVTIPQGAGPPWHDLLRSPGLTDAFRLCVIARCHSARLHGLFAHEAFRSSFKRAFDRLQVRDKITDNINREREREREQRGQGAPTGSLFAEWKKKKKKEERKKKKRGRGRGDAISLSHLSHKEGKQLSEWICQG